MVFVFGEKSKAQSNKEETDFYQSIFGMAKKEVVTYFLKIENNNPFWAMYDEYETKRKELHKERLAAFEGTIYWKAWQADIKQSGHYYHYNSKNIEVDTRVLPIGNFMLVLSDGAQTITKQIAIMR